MALGTTFFFFFLFPFILFFLLLIFILETKSHYEVQTDSNSQPSYPSLPSLPSAGTRRYHQAWPLTASFTSDVPGLPLNREALEIIPVALEVTVCDIKDAGYRRTRDSKDGEPRMPEITRARAERNPLPSPLAKLQAGLKLVNKTETPMRIFALQDQLKLCEDSRSQTAALISASLPKCKANKILALDSEKNKYTRIVFHVLA